MGRIAGFFQVKVNGVLQSAKGEFESGYGTPKRSTVFNSDGRPAGWKEEPQVAYMSGKITDRQDLDLKALFNATDMTVTLHKANGKTEVLSKAFYAGDATLTTAEAEADFRMEGESLEEV
jgi:hypothetical protein